MLFIFYLCDYMVEHHHHKKKIIIASKFVGAKKECLELAEAYRNLSTELEYFYFDVDSVTRTSQIDGKFYIFSYIKSSVINTFLNFTYQAL